jgi:tryptophan 2,3-dioxygenase
MAPTGQGQEGRHTRTCPLVSITSGTLPATTDAPPDYVCGVANQRDLESGIERDFTSQMSYGDYLRLDLLLAAQQPQSDPPQHDELLFIVQHQTAELWLKLLVHELRSARSLLRADDLSPALKRLARVKHVQHVLTDQWAVLATMTPSEYALIRPFLATSSGFQSAQYREVEFLLGNKNAEMVKVFAHEPQAQAELEQLLVEPSLYDEFLAYLSRRGYVVPAELLDRDCSQPHRVNEVLVETFAGVYAAPEEHWGVYETCEELVDVEDNFQEWRFRHLQVVQRTIGHKTGTGGSSGVDFLRRALDLTFFPELYEVRTRIGS